MQTHLAYGCPPPWQVLTVAHSEARMPLDLLMILILAILTALSFAYIAGLERI